MASDERPASTTIPSATPKPASSPSKSNPPTRTTPSAVQRIRIQALRSLALHVHRHDRFLVRLSALLESPASTDALLGTLGYTLELLAALLSRFLTHRLVSLASSIANKAEDVLLPGETLVATLPTPSSEKLLSQVATGSKALAAVIGDFRIFVRMWGLAGLYMWARGLWNAPLGTEAGAKERAVRRITWAQIGSLVLFQVLENGAYLASKGVLTSDAWSGEAGKTREGAWWVWSSRFWAAHVALELVRVGVLRYYGDGKLASETEKDVVGDGEKEGKLLMEQKRRERWVWWRDAVSNIAYMPMTLHWSVEEEKGFLSDWGVGLLGAIAGGSLLLDAWKQTA
ncbi:uncharacterized protein CC84DRAFT_1018407 [Paraphaeosphaeria sporulosa]|uniref:Peroxin 11C n=1 Tax=Paraphaeosphaeria sporulosa TaxID=1460663 RepID=A0A177C5G4_9PLEO|nr:uncharacterized protein CC84DRAFT_1018407 [Paraphaeosphaeria sporulosa]OAG02391.1 hypothetical protein CC84DRAFT_1018407 [Paraphaeosphaeria sporulosa]